MNELNVIATARYISADSVQNVITQWKLSSNEANALRLLVAHRDNSESDATVENLVKMISMNLLSVNEADLILKFEGNNEELTKWATVEFPEFPINGNDVLALGFKGKDVGRELKAMRAKWVASGYTLTKNELLKDYENGN